MPPIKRREPSLAWSKPTDENGKGKYVIDAGFSWIGECKECDHLECKNCARCGQFFHENVDSFPNFAQCVKDLDYSEMMMSIWRGMYMGMHVLIRNEKFEGAFANQVDAYKQAIARFGNVPFLVRAIEAEDAAPFVLMMK